MMVLKAPTTVKYISIADLQSQILNNQSKSKPNSEIPSLRLKFDDKELAIAEETKQSLEIMNNQETQSLSEHEDAIMIDKNIMHQFDYQMPSNIKVA